MNNSNTEADDSSVRSTSDTDRCPKCGVGPDLIEDEGNYKACLNCFKEFDYDE